MVLPWQMFLFAVGNWSELDSRHFFHHDDDD